MKSYIYLIVLGSSLCACTAREAALVDDIIQGEASTIEKVIADQAASSPSVTVVKKSF